MRYKRIKTEGQGGFGKVFKYKDQNLDRYIVKKKIEDISGLKRLLDEISALEIAKSKNVVQIYDVIVRKEPKDIAIIEEYLPGSDLIDYRASSSDITGFLKILYQLACGLADIHNCGIVHRDFKPNNVKYDAENNLKIFDFGLAKIDKLPTTTIGLIGTFGFMAPELFKKKPIIDKPVDCYSFGATAFYFVLGKRAACALNKPSPRALSANESISKFINLSGPLTRLIDSCLEIIPNNRPTMAEIKKALEAELLFGKHKATIVLEGKVFILKEVQKGVRIKRGDHDFVIIFYNGYDFLMNDIEGDVYVNDLPSKNGDVLPGASVITLGSANLGAQRRFSTFDISHPEVVI